MTAQDLEAGGPHQQELVLRLSSLTPDSSPTSPLGSGRGGKWLKNIQSEKASPAEPTVGGSSLTSPISDPVTCVRCGRGERPHTCAESFLAHPSLQAT